jgi:hypothetical protein
MFLTGLDVAPLVTLQRPSRSRDSSVGKAMAWKTRVRLPAVQDFIHLHRVQTESGAHPVGIGVSFPGGEAAGA